METNTEGREEKIDRIHELSGGHLPDGTFDEECINDDGEFLADVHAILSYENGGAESVFSSTFHELCDLRHDIRVMASPHARSHPAEVLPDCMEFLDTVEWS